MATSVDSLCNHYDTLRIAPTATNNEIADAFAAQMRAVRVRPDMTVARIAKLSLAYETLRDPTKRRAYDDKLGLNRPAPAPPQVKAAPYVVGTYGPSRVTFVPAAPAAKEPVRPNAPAEPRVAAFIAASLREPPPRRETEMASASKPVPRPAPAPEAIMFTPSPEVAVPLIERNHANIAACVVGLAALALAVSLPMTNADSLPTPAALAPQTAAITVGLPPATPVQDYVVPPQAAPVAGAAQRQVERSAPPVKAAEAPPAPAPSRGEGIAEQVTAERPAVEIAADQPPAVETTAVSTEPDRAVAGATMPLPNATIARTIERIGYSCGSVSSIAADTGAGAFKVTCSSGDSYRAAPKGGRYHFLRLGSH